MIDDFNGDNFDHGGLGFFGGAWISAGTTNGRPILTRPVPPGTPRWGREWKQATAKWYSHAFNIGASGLQLFAPREFSRPRPDLQGCARPAAHPHELQFPR